MCILQKESKKNTKNTIFSMDKKLPSNKRGDRKYYIVGESGKSCTYNIVLRVYYKNNLKKNKNIIFFYGQKIAKQQEGRSKTVGEEKVWKVA